MFIPIMVMFGIAPPLSATFANATDASAAGAAASRLFAVLDRPSRIDPTCMTGETLESVTGAVGRLVDRGAIPMGTPLGPTPAYLEARRAPAQPGAAGPGRLRAS